MVKISYSSSSKHQLQLNCDSYFLDDIRSYFSIPNKAFGRNSRFAQTRLYSITPSGKFDSGLLDNVLAYLEANQIKYEINDDVQLDWKNGVDNQTIFKFKNIEYREHQEKSIKKALEKGKGVIVIPTAGGKTLIMAGLIESLKQKDTKSDLCLVIVPSIQLVEQTCNDFISYGIKNVTKWSGNNKPDLNADVIVAGTQILLSDKTDLSILSDVDILLFDECHGIKRNNEINKIFKLIKTNHKFGFTGTLPICKLDQWNIIGKIGPIVYEEKTLNLKNKNYISNFKIFILNIIHTNIPSFQLNFQLPAQAYQQELDFLIQNERRNDIICKLANQLTNNTIIMVDRIDHGIVLHSKLLKISEKNVYFIRGETEIEEREQIRALMNEKNDVIVVAISKIFSTGINIPNLHNIIFASAGKAKIKIMQSIGRALRLHPTKVNANIFDLADNTKYGKMHLKERKKLYNEEKFIYEEKTIK
jgi:superfamily II DNA or RNA helicase